MNEILLSNYKSDIINFANKQLVNVSDDNLGISLNSFDTAFKSAYTDFDNEDLAEMDKIKEDTLREFKDKANIPNFIPKAEEWDTYYAPRPDFSLAKTAEEKIKMSVDWKAASLEKATDLIPSYRKDFDTHLEYITNNDIRESVFEAKRSKGGMMAWLDDKTNRTIEGGLTMVAPFFEGSDRWLAENFPEDPSTSDDFSSQIFAGAGQLVAQAGIALGTSAIAGPEAGAAAIGTIYSARALVEGYKEEMRKSGNASKALDVGLAGIPGAMFETVADKMLFGMGKSGKAYLEAFKAATTREAKEAILKEAFPKMGKEALKQGFQEATLGSIGADWTTGYGRYLASGDDSYIPSAEQLGKGALVEGILGAGYSSLNSMAFDGIRTEAFAKELADKNKSKANDIYKSLAGKNYQQAVEIAARDYPDAAPAPAAKPAAATPGATATPAAPNAPTPASGIVIPQPNASSKIISASSLGSENYNRLVQERERLKKENSTDAGDVEKLKRLTESIEAIKAGTYQEPESFTLNPNQFTPDKGFSEVVPDPTDKDSHDVTLDNGKFIKTDGTTIFVSGFDKALALTKAIERGEVGLSVTEGKDGGTVMIVSPDGGILKHSKPFTYTDRPGSGKTAITLKQSFARGEEGSKETVVTNFSILGKVDKSSKSKESKQKDSDVFDKLAAKEDGEIKDSIAAASIKEAKEIVESVGNNTSFGEEIINGEGGLSEKILNLVKIFDAYTQSNPDKADAVNDAKEKLLNAWAEAKGKVTPSPSAKPVRGNVPLFQARIGEQQAQDQLDRVPQQPSQQFESAPELEGQSFEEEVKFDSAKLDEELDQQRESVKKVKKERKQKAAPAAKKENVAVVEANDPFSYAKNLINLFPSLVKSGVTVIDAKEALINLDKSWEDNVKSGNATVLDKLIYDANRNKIQSVIDGNGNGDVGGIWFKKDKTIVISDKSTPSAIAHEVGHAIMEFEYINASDEIKNEIEKEYKSWFNKKYGKSGIPTFSDQRRIWEWMEDSDWENADKAFPKEERNKNWENYRSTFSEWFADEVAKWATVKEKPKSLIDKFFFDIANKLKNLWSLVSKNFSPSESISSWLDIISSQEVDNINTSNESSNKETKTFAMMSHDEVQKGISSSKNNIKERWDKLKATRAPSSWNLIGNPFMATEDGGYFYILNSDGKYKTFSSIEDALGKRTKSLERSLKDRKWKAWADHQIAINKALNERLPVSKVAADFYKIKIPDGYKIDGDLYIYDQNGTKQPTPSNITSTPEAIFESVTDEGVVVETQVFPYEVRVVEASETLAPRVVEGVVPASEPIVLDDEARIVAAIAQAKGNLELDPSYAVTIKELEDQLALVRATGAPDVTTAVQQAKEQPELKEQVNEVIYKPEQQKDQGSNKVISDKVDEYVATIENPTGKKKWEDNKNTIVEFIAKTLYDPKNSREGFESLGNAILNRAETIASELNKNVKKQIAKDKAKDDIISAEVRRSEKIKYSIGSEQTGVTIDPKEAQDYITKNHPGIETVNTRKTTEDGHQWRGRTDFTSGTPRIAINLANIRDLAQLRNVIHEELAHIAYNDPSISTSLKKIVESTKLQEELTGLYSPGDVFEESVVKRMADLVDSYTEKGAFGRLVTAIKSLFKDTFGMELNDSDLSYIAYRAIVRAGKNIKNENSRRDYINLYGREPDSSRRRFIKNLLATSLAAPISGATLNSIVNQDKHFRASVIKSNEIDNETLAIINDASKSKPSDAKVSVNYDEIYNYINNIDIYKQDLKQLQYLMDNRDAFDSKIKELLGIVEVITGKKIKGINISFNQEYLASDEGSTKKPGEYNELNFYGASTSPDGNVKISIKTAYELLKQSNSENYIAAASNIFNEATHVIQLQELGEFDAIAINGKIPNFISWSYNRIMSDIYGGSRYNAGKMYKAEENSWYVDYLSTKALEVKLGVKRKDISELDWLFEKAKNEMYNPYGNPEKVGMFLNDPLRFNKVESNKNSTTSPLFEPDDDALSVATGKISEEKKRTLKNLKRAIRKKLEKELIIDEPQAWNALKAVNYRYLDGDQLKSFNALLWQFVRTRSKSKDPGIGVRTPTDTVIAEAAELAKAANQGHFNALQLQHDFLEGKDFQKDFQGDIDKVNQLAKDERGMKDSDTLTDKDADSLQTWQLRMFELQEEAWENRDYLQDRLDEQFPSANNITNNPIIAKRAGIYTETVDDVMAGHKEVAKQYINSLMSDPTDKTWRELRRQYYALQDFLADGYLNVEDFVSEDMSALLQGKISEEAFVKMYNAPWRSKMHEGAASFYTNTRTMGTEVAELAHNLTKKFRAGILAAERLMADFIDPTLQEFMDKAVALNGGKPFDGQQLNLAGIYGRARQFKATESVTEGILKSKAAIEESLKKDTNSIRTGRKEAALIHSKFTSDLYAGIDANTPNEEALGILEANAERLLPAGLIGYVKDVVDLFEVTKPLSRFTSEFGLGRPFDEIINYIPSMAINKDGTPVKTEGLLITNTSDDVAMGVVGEINKDTNMQQSGGSSTKVRKGYLPEGMVYAWNINHEAHNRMRLNLNDYLTLPQRRELNNIISGKGTKRDEFAKLLKDDGQQERVSHIQRSVLTMWTNTVQASNYVSEWQGFMNWLSNMWASTKLASAYQLPGQIGSNTVPYFIVHAGSPKRIKYLFDAMGIILKRRSGMPLDPRLAKTVDRVLSVIESRSQEQFLDKSIALDRTSNQTLEKLKSSKLWNSVKGINKLRETFLFSAFKFSDYVSGAPMMLANIMHHEETAGRATGWEGLTYNDDSFIRSLDETERFIGIGAASRRGVWTNNKNGWMSITRNIISAFSSHRVNNATNFAVEYARIRDENISPEEKLKSLRYIMAIGAQSAVFSAVKWAMIGGFYNILSAAMGEDENEDELEKEYRKLLTGNHKPGDKKIIEAEIAMRQKVRNEFIRAKENNTRTDIVLIRGLQDVVANTFLIPAVSDIPLNTVIHAVYDQYEAERFKEAKEGEVKVLEERLKKAKASKNTNLAIQLQKDLSRWNAQEAIPLVYEQKGVVPIGGLYGGVVNEASKFMDAAAGSLIKAEAMSLQDALLGAGLIGLSQPDINRWARMYSKIEEYEDEFVEKLQEIKEKEVKRARD